MNSGVLLSFQDCNLWNGAAYTQSMLFHFIQPNLENPSMTHTEIFSQVILDPLKLTIYSNHHTLLIFFCSFLQHVLRSLHKQHGKANQFSISTNPLHFSPLPDVTIQQSCSVNMEELLIYILERKPINHKDSIYGQDHAHLSHNFW